jgi:serine/threonine protein kinase
MVTAQTTTVASGGTPAYKAPEQYDSGQFGKIGPKTDMWALGCVVIEMLTGFVPWKGTPPLEIMMNVAGKRLAPTIPQEAKGVLSAVLQRCFSHEQISRPTAQEALAMLHQEPITSCAPGPTINIPERCEASVWGNGGGKEEHLDLDLDRHQNEASPPQTQTPTLQTSLLPTQLSTTNDAQTSGDADNNNKKALALLLAFLLLWGGVGGVADPQGGFDSHGTLLALLFWAAFWLALLFLAAALALFLRPLCQR